jgi:PPM family protein phosphatase
MTLAIRYAVRSDVGLLREGNEDSAYAGPHLLVIADGMGGHAAGEVASSVAISALKDLDTEVEGDEELPGNTLVAALSAAIASANSALHHMSIEDPSTEGMGTTLTAMLWSGARFALCHIGDSRAYLLRDGELSQITRDHTLVQSLVDDGRLSPAQAATHPQRSLIMRALQGSSEAEPDLSIREAIAGDRYLLCSDGLTDVVSEETLRKVLAQPGDRDEVVTQLIDLAIRGGGPDNITCIIADVVDTAVERAPSQPAVIVGAASAADGMTLPRATSPAGRASLLTRTTAVQPAVAKAGPPPGQPGGGTGDEPDGDGAQLARRRRRWPVVTSILVVLIIVIVGGGFAGWRYTQGQYYVGTDGNQVIIYRGINQRVLGLSLSSVFRKTGVPLSHVPTADVQAVKNTITSSSLKDAEATVTNIRHTYGCQQYAAAHAKWLAGKPKPHKVKKKVNGKTREVTVTPSYRPAPTPPAWKCPAQAASG